MVVHIVTQGTISVGVDASDLFDHYEEDYEEISAGGGSGLPHIEINRMHISQSIEVDAFYILILECTFIEISCVKFLYYKCNS